eukprot:2504139-Rhodomonas_salina.1
MFKSASCSRVWASFGTLLAFLRTSNELIVRAVPHCSDHGGLDRAQESNAIPSPTLLRTGGGHPFLPPRCNALGQDVSSPPGAQGQPVGASTRPPSGPRDI